MAGSGHPGRQARAGPAVVRCAALWLLMQCMLCGVAAARAMSRFRRRLLSVLPDLAGRTVPLLLAHCTRGFVSTCCHVDLQVRLPLSLRQPSICCWAGAAVCSGADTVSGSAMQRRGGSPAVLFRHCGSSAAGQRRRQQWCWRRWQRQQQERNDARQQWQTTSSAG